MVVRVAGKEGGELCSKQGIGGKAPWVFMSTPPTYYERVGGRECRAHTIWGRDAP